MNASPIWHPFTQHALKEPIPLVMRAEGAVLHTADGRRIVDAISSWWVTTHGHNHPRITAAIRDQAERLDQIIFAGWTHEPAETLAEGLRAILPASLTRVFFSDSGSTSVEVAIKMALGYWAGRNEPRHRVLVLQHGYHGDTIGAMSVGERGVFNRAYAPLLFDVATVPFPDAEGETRALEVLERACATKGEDAAAAFIVEPLVLGAGGMKMYSPSVLARMHEICAQSGVLFIADEVMTAWGRTGTLLACEQAGIAPDILCLSKGITGGALPLAVTLARESIFEAHWSTDRARMFFHSSSYTANPIACAAANANLAIWREEPVTERIEALETKQAAYAVVLAAHPKIKNVRRLGTIVACEIAGEDGYLSALAPRLLAHFGEQDLLLRPLGSTVYVMPPYSIEDADLARVFSAVVQAADLAGPPL